MRICNHCGRMYDEHLGGCSCRTKEKRTYKHIGFYDSTAWRSLSRYIRMRDYEQDRLCMYLMKAGRPKESCIMQRLYDYCIDVTGLPRYRDDRLIVHHIVPREDDYSRQYDVTNLLTVGNAVHEYIHQLYLHHKKETQGILQDAVMASLP